MLDKRGSRLGVGWEVGRVFCMGEFVRQLLRKGKVADDVGLIN